MRRQYAIERFVAFAIALSLHMPANATAGWSTWERLNYDAQRLYEHGDFQKARSIWQKALNVAGKSAPHSNELETTYANLAMVETSLGNPGGALLMQKKSLATAEASSGKDSAATARALTGEGECLLALKRGDEAELFFSRALPIFETGKEVRKCEAVLTLNNLARCYQSEGKVKEAEHTYKSALEKAESRLAKGDAAIGVICNSLAGFYLEEKKFPEAEEYWLRAISLGKAGDPINPFGTATMMSNLASLYASEKRADEADKLLKESLELAEAHLSTGIGRYRSRFTTYIDVLVKNGHKDDADHLIKFADDHDPDRLATALKNLESKPKLAEHELEASALPTAKVYLAYLYFTGKVAVANRSQKVDKLMNAAIAELLTAGALGSIDRAKQYHYTDIATLLEHLRFLTDADGLNLAIPESIFKNYPVAAFNAVRCWYGASGDGYLNVAADPKEDVVKIADVAKYEKILQDLLGDPSPYSTGTCRFMFYRRQALSFLEVSMTPQIFLSAGQRVPDKIKLRFNKFMEFWSNQELWNKVKYREWQKAAKGAETALAQHYAEHFRFSQRQARFCAKAAIEAINVAYLGEYSSDPFETTVVSRVYKIFRNDGLTLAQVKQALHGHALSKDELETALRLAILNDGSIDLVKWIIKQGAPLTGDREPALFTAVCRPEVVSLLLKSGAKVNEQNLLKKTALVQACQFNSLPSVKILVAAGADIQAPMRKAEGVDDSELKFNPAYNYTIGKRTPLMYATAFAGYPVIQYLLNHGADSNAVATDGATAGKYLGDNKLISKGERRNLIKMLCKSGSNKTTSSTN